MKSLGHIDTGSTAAKLAKEHSVSEATVKRAGKFADEVVANGGEGAVVRDPRAPYVAGRSGSVLRWVPQDPAINRRRAA